MSDYGAHSPVDEDLQRMYNEVWAGFSEEGVRQPEGDLDDFYGAYSSESAPPIPPKPHNITSQGMDSSHSSRRSQTATI